MKYFALFLVLGILFSGCLGYFEFESEGEPRLVEAPADMEEAPVAIPEPEPPAEEEVQEEMEETPDGIAEPVEEIEVDEEKLVQWDVGVTYEDKEAGKRTLQVLEFGEYILVVDDITDDKPYPCAALSIGILHETYIETLFRDKVCPGESAYWESPEGDKYRIKVFETAAGYAGYAYWADVAIYKQR